MKNGVHTEHNGVVIKNGEGQAYEQSEQDGERGSAGNSKTQPIDPQLFVHHFKEDQPVDQKDRKAVFTDH